MEREVHGRDRMGRGISEIGSAHARPVQSEAALTWRDALWILIAMGVVLGAIRVLGLAIANLWLERFIQQGVNFLWTGPLGTTLLTLGWGVLIWSTGAFVPALRRLHVFIGAAAWLPVTSLVLNANGIHPLSAAVLAAGTSAVAMRVTLRRPSLAKRAGRRIAMAGMAGVALAFIAVVVAAPRIESWKAARMSPPPAGAPNILLIVLDTVRAKSLGAYGHTRDTSPFLDELGKSGVRFAQAFAPAPWTTPTHASMMTGLWPTELGLDWKHTLDHREPTVAEVLTGAGYLTAGFVANVGNAGINSGIARGFAHFEDYPVSFWNVLRGSKLGEHVTSSVWLRNAMGIESSPDRKRSPQVSAEFLAWLDAQPERPFFAFLNYFDAHYPYEAPPEFDARFGATRDPKGAVSTPLDWMEWDEARTEAARRRYDAAIAYQDDQLRRLFAELERRGKLENTLVIVTSDHGEEFGGHGVMRHGNSLYRASVHVPLVVLFPNRIQPGRVVATPVSVRSVAASLTHVVPGLPPNLFRGPSLFDVVADAALAEPVLSSLDGVKSQPAHFPVHDGPLYSVVDKGYRYIVNAEGAEELFRLDDIDEKFDLAASPDARGILSELRKTLNMVMHAHPDRRRSADWARISVTGSRGFSSPPPGSSAFLRPPGPPR